MSTLAVLIEICKELDIMPKDWVALESKIKSSLAANYDRLEKAHLSQSDSWDDAQEAIKQTNYLLDSLDKADSSRIKASLNGLVRDANASKSLFDFYRDYYEIYDEDSLVFDARKRYIARTKASQRRHRQRISTLWAAKEDYELSKGELLALIKDIETYCFDSLLDFLKIPSSYRSGVAVAKESVGDTFLYHIFLGKNSAETSTELALRNGYADGHYILCPVRGLIYRRKPGECGSYTIY